MLKEIVHRHFEAEEPETGMRQLICESTYGNQMSEIMNLPD